MTFDLGDIDTIIQVKVYVNINDIATVKLTIDIRRLRLATRHRKCRSSRADHVSLWQQNGIGI